MPSIRVKENEPFDVAIRRFRRACEKAGVLTEVRRREYYEKPTEVRKRKAAAAVKRHAKRSFRGITRRSRPIATASSSTSTRTGSSRPGSSRPSHR